MKKIGRHLTAAASLGPLLTGRDDGDRKTLKQRQCDDASNNGKHDSDDIIADLKQALG
jgi:hypothetical protein